MEFNRAILRKLPEFVFSPRGRACVFGMLSGGHHDLCVSTCMEWRFLWTMMITS